MNKLNTQEQVRVIQALVEGNSVNSTVRMTGIAKTMILRLINKLADACQKFHDEQVKGLTTKRIQCDEVWAFCHCKQKNVRPDLRGFFGIGDVWTWTAIDADSKLMISWLVAPRHAGSANAIMKDVSDRLTHRVQLTTDGHHTYLNGVWNVFEEGIDYAQLIKLHGQQHIGPGRYSPPKCIGIETKPCIGDPGPNHVSTSFVERSNLTVRMGLRRHTRLTNGHSKKLENHVAMTAIFFCYYNWCRIHTTARQTPAMSAGLTKKLWEIEDLLGLIGNI